MNSQSRTVSARDRLIVALDVPTQTEALNFVRDLSPEVSFFKIGLQLYTAAGPEIVRAVLATSAKVFLDLKLHDIPNTAARTVETAVWLEAQISSSLADRLLHIRDHAKQ